MTISVATIGALASTAGASTYAVTLTRAPAANTLVLVQISNDDTAPSENPSSVSGAGMVFTQVSERSYAADVNHFTIWRSMSAAPDASVISAAYSDAQTGCNMLVHEYSGVSTSGTSGANAVGTSTTTVVTGAASSATLFLPSFASTANGVHVGVGVNLNSTADAPNAQYIKIAQGAHTNNPNGTVSGWTTSSGVTQCVFSGAGSGLRGAIAVEIVADNPPAVAAGQHYYAGYFSRVIAA